MFDANPAKQGRFLPGSHIPIHAPEHLLRLQPDDVVILPWNLAEEITRQLGSVKGWGGRFVLATPYTRILP